MKIDIISDTICPWCFIGKRRLEQALKTRPQADLEISWQPFQLNPDMPADGMEREAYLAAKFGSQDRAGRAYQTIAQAGGERGIDSARPSGSGGRLPMEPVRRCDGCWDRHADRGAGARPRTVQPLACVRQRPRGAAERGRRPGRVWIQIQKLPACSHDSSCLSALLGPGTAILG